VKLGQFCVDDPLGHPEKQQQMHQHTRSREYIQGTERVKERPEKAERVRSDTDTETSTRTHNAG